MIAAVVAGALGVLGAAAATATVKPLPSRPNLAAPAPGPLAGSRADTLRGLLGAVAGEARAPEPSRSAGIRLIEPLDVDALEDLEIGLFHLRTAQEASDYARAAAHFRRAARIEAGRVALAYVLGFGLGAERDESLARSLLLDVRDPYRARAWYLLGLLDERSPAPQRNARARMWFSCAAAAGDALALNHVAVALERARRASAAADLYDAAARHGAREGADNGQRLFDAERERVHRDDIDELRVRARAGDRDAMFVLAQAFHRGHGVPADYTEALRWYRLAAQKGHPEARRMVGLILARPLNEASVDPPWMRHLSLYRIDGRRGPYLSALERAPQGERDPLHGIETLHLQPPVSTHCEVTP